MEANSFAAVTGLSAGWLAAAQAGRGQGVCAINSVTINSTGSVWGRRLTGCMQGRYTVAWQACRYLIDLSGFTNVGR